MIRASVVLALCLAALAAGQFEIDYERDTFLMNGEPFRFVSGALHYFHMPRQYWRNRLQKLKAAGLNTVSTYVEWSFHEPEPGQYDFTGDRNITEFIKTAEEEGFYVILRVGPFICAERSMGGFPYWLLRDDRNIGLRYSDERYKGFVETWLNKFMPIVKPLYFGNGGPIISVQVENEYGFSGHCDHDYTSWLGDVFKRHVEDKAVLFTNDGPDYEPLSCGKIPGILTTLDFGPGYNVTQIKENLRAVEPHGPFVDSEFYPGWVTHWGDNWARRDTDDVLQTLKDILDLDGNVNIYMMSGGSNFGFTAGANSGPYKSFVTSYDFDAPITEAGDITDKYLAIRELLLNYFSLNTTLPEESPKGNYGVLNLKYVGKFASTLLRQRLGNTYASQYPLHFEAMYQDGGYVLYSTVSPVSGDNVNLEVDARDFSHVYVNGQVVGVLRREFEEKSLSLSVKEGDEISIVSENLGRVNLGVENNDAKGLLSNATLDGTILENWNETGYSFDKIDEVIAECLDAPDNCKNGFGFTLYSGSFIANVTSNIEYNRETFPADTYLDVSGLKKGYVFINGFNLGRYWSTRGPVYSLYVPGTILKHEPAINTVVLLEEEEDSDSLTVPFILTPIYGDPKS